jgi:hypothetical protein
MYLVIGGLFILLAGCATGTASLKDLPEGWPSLGTTRQEVQARLGEPSTHVSSIERDGPEEIWIYEYEQSETHPLLAVVAGIAVVATGQERSGEAKTLVLRFDQDGKVVGRWESNQKIGTSPAAPTDEYVR